MNFLTHKGTSLNFSFARGTEQINNRSSSPNTSGLGITSFIEKCLAFRVETCFKKLWGTNEKCWWHQLRRVCAAEKKRLLNMASKNIRMSERQSREGRVSLASSYKNSFCVISAAVVNRNLSIHWHKCTFVSPEAWGSPEDARGISFFVSYCTFFPPHRN